MKSGVSPRRNLIVSRALCATLSFCKVVWRRYLGEVGKFNRTVWLIYPRHCTPISIKIGQHLLKLCTKVFWCVFYAPQCINGKILETVKELCFLVVNWYWSVCHCFHRFREPNFYWKMLYSVSVNWLKSWTVIDRADDNTVGLCRPTLSICLDWELTAMVVDGAYILWVSIKQYL